MISIGQAIDADPLRPLADRVQIVADGAQPLAVFDVGGVFDDAVVDAVVVVVDQAEDRSALLRETIILPRLPQVIATTDPTICGSAIRVSSKPLGTS